MVGGLRGQLPRPLGGLAVWALEHLPDRAINWIGDRFRGRSPIHRATVELYLYWANGVDTFADYLRAIARYDAHDLASHVACPVLVVQGEGEGDVPRRMAEQFVQRLTAPTRYRLLRAQDGADNHCGLGNLRHAHQTMYDWLDETFGHADDRATHHAGSAADPVIGA